LGKEKQKIVSSAVCEHLGVRLKQSILP